MPILETTKRLGKTICHVVKLDSYELRNCCIENDFCTLATEEEYAKILSMPKESRYIMDIDCIYDIATKIALVSDLRKFEEETGLGYDDFILHIMYCIRHVCRYYYEIMEG